MALEIAQSKACRELNLPENTIYGWMHAYRMGKLDLSSEMQTPARALTMKSEDLLKHDFYSNIPAKKCITDIQKLKYKTENDTFLPFLTATTQQSLDWQ